MSAEDKFGNMADKAKGKIKETSGKVTGDDKQQAEGKAEQAKADVKKAGENIKDAFNKD